MIKNKFCVIMPTYNAEQYVEEALESLIAQTYTNWEAIVINDCSTDHTLALVQGVAKKEPRIHIHTPNEKKCALENTVIGIKMLCKGEEDIVVILDGDDKLKGPDVLDYLNKEYQKNIWTTWGNFELLSDGQPCTYQDPKTKKIVPWADKLDKPFNRREMGRFLFSHLRTYKYWLFKQIHEADFLDAQGNYYTTAGDVIVSLPLIEMAGLKHSENISKVMYTYNNLSSLNDSKKCPVQQNKIFDLFKLQKIPYAEIKPTVPIDCMIWSKDRAMQLDLLLRSVRDMYPDVNKVHVRYDYSTEEFKQAYDRIRDTDYDINICYYKQGTLEQDTKDILRAITSKYMFCCVDDGVFIAPLRNTDRLLEAFTEDVSAISIRMSPDITYCYGSKMDSPVPKFTECKHNYLKWKWSESHYMTDWGYPGAIDSQIYRTQWLRDIILPFNFTLPTHLETHLNTNREKFFKPYMVSNNYTCLLNVPMNRIQQEWFHNPHGEIDPQELNKLFLDNYKIDTSNIYGYECNMVNAEINFNFIKV